MLIRSRLAATLASLSLIAATMPLSAAAQPGAVVATAPATTAATAPATATTGAPASSPAADFAAQPAASVAAADTVRVENPYGLEALWKSGDFIARGTLLILIVMSMGSWYLIIAKLLEQARVLRRARAVDEGFWRVKSLTEAAGQLQAGSPFRFVAESGLAARDHYDGALTEQVDLNTWTAVAIERATTSVSNRLQDGLAFLGTVGSTAPFVGLFGTVWGIYHALTAIGIAGQASIDKVAGPVGEALIMTAIGLAVAVPAVLGYNWLVRRNKAVMERVRGFAADLHTALLTGKTMTATVAVTSKAAPMARVG